jgi:nucleotide-binding universal stress UspA family protein
MKANKTDERHLPEAAAGTARIANILVLLDGSDLALKALLYATRLAELFGSTIRTLQVVESVNYPMGNLIQSRVYGPDELASKAARGHSGERLRD